MQAPRKAFQDIVAVWKRQTRNWRTVAKWATFRRFFRQLPFEYSNICIRQLGANPVQLGMVNSTAGISSTLISGPLGWLQDRYSLRKILLMGAVLLTIVPLLYVSASSWMMIIPAIFLLQLAQREVSCVVICDVSLETRDRSTARAICETLGYSIVILAPITAAYVITFFGGISVAGIRPLYWIQFAGSVVLLLYIGTQLTEIKREKVTKTKTSFIGDFREVFERGTAIKRFILIYTLGMFVESMATPFRNPFAYEIKGAEQFVLGWMASSATILQVLFSIIAGRISDKVGRKKVFYVGLIPIIASDLLLIAAPTSKMLIVSGALYGFQRIVQLVSISSILPELVPIDCRGRWRGLLNLCAGLASIPAPIIGGFIWETLGPHYVFLARIGVNLLLRIPIMVTLPETLKLANES